MSSLFHGKESPHSRSGLTTSPKEIKNTVAQEIKKETDHNQK